MTKKQIKAVTDVIAKLKEKWYIEGETDNKGADGSVRFKAEPFEFGEEKVYISKEWYERQKVLFNEWYTNLFAIQSNDSK